MGRMTTIFRAFALFFLSTLLWAAPASAEVAPGRVTFPVGDAGTVPSVDPFGLTVGVALPDGRVTLAGVDRGDGVVLAQLRPDGSLDPSFGDGGLSRVRIPFATGMVGPMPLQLLRRPDGRLVLVVPGPSNSKYELQQLLVAGLTREGRLDTSFGEGGVARPGIQGSCASCSPASLQPDGKIVLTGNTGSVPTAVERDPTVVPDFKWVVARITEGGALDSSFGQGGVATLPGKNAVGYGTAVLPGGFVGVVGAADGGPKVARLTPAGTPDPAFNGGAAVTPSGSHSFWFHVLGRADGSIDVLGSGRGEAEVQRYTAGGAPDPTFGTGGTVKLAGGVSIDELLAAPDGSTIVAGPTSFETVAGSLKFRISRITSDGKVANTKLVPIPFGGGLATVFARMRAPRVTSLDQSGYRPGRALLRADGSVVLPGAVGVIQYTGEGAGYMAEQAAIAALTPSFGLDPSFGGPVRPARISIRVPRQRARLTTHRNLLRVAVTATTSGPGLCLLEVKAGRTVVARSTAPVFRSGTQRLRALLTPTGRRKLRNARNVRVTVTAKFRDFVRSTATARARGTLR
jgi:uncharacterized delta-60 repeat protein